MADDFAAEQEVSFHGPIHAVEHAADFDGDFLVGADIMAEFFQKERDTFLRFLRQLDKFGLVFAKHIAHTMTASFHAVPLSLFSRFSYRFL